MEIFDLESDRVGFYGKHFRRVRFSNLCLGVFSVTLSLCALPLPCSYINVVFAIVSLIAFITTQKSRFKEALDP